MKKYFLLACFFAFSGCATMPKSMPIKPQSYHRDFSEVWSASLDALDSLRLVPKQIQKEDGYIITETFDTKIHKKSSWEANAMYGQVGMDEIFSGGTQAERARVTIRISKEKPVTIVVKSAIEHLGAYDWKAVESNGALENKIQSAIEQNLSHGK